ncbi:hypothetical protein E4U44_006912 [Claviceps purpurea]|nr:hypothetical protein E4U44_006912 [Claviceps purpurea]
MILNSSTAQSLSWFLTILQDRPSSSIKIQADVIRRDRLRQKKDKRTKRMVILKRNWREPVNAAPSVKLPKTSQPSMIHEGARVAYQR